MNKAEKEQQIASMSERFSESVVALCADYRGLTVEEISNLRSELKKGNAQGYVVKNTLARISADNALSEAEEAERQKFLNLFQGPNFVIFAKDEPVSSAKALTKFAKEYDNLEIRGGWFEGAFIDENGIKALSSMPSREELLAKLLNLMNAPAVQLLRLMKAPSQQLVQVVEAHRQNLEKGE